MDSINRKALMILIIGMVAEGIPMAILLESSNPGVLGRLYGAKGSAAWLAAALVTLFYIGLSCRGFPMIAQRFFEAHWLKLVAIPFALITGTMEEVWFRKMVMDGALTLGLSLPAQIAIAAVSFGLVHAVWGVFARQWRVACGAALATGLLGLLLAGVYALADRHVAPCVWSHIAINLAIEPWLLVAALSRSPSKR
jgi:hypothetical protein